MHPNYDIVIIGGGLIANSLLAAFANIPLSIAVVEASDPTSKINSKTEGRTFALTPATKNFFTNVNAWPTENITPIKSVHVSQRGRFAATQLTAAQAGMDALGYCVPANTLISELIESGQRSRATWMCPASCDGIEFNKTGALVRLLQNNQNKIVRAKCVIAADGTHSTLREMVGLSVVSTDYGETAIATKIELEEPHAFQAFERFTEQGTIAVLPQMGNTAGLVWVLPSEQATEILELSDEAFLQRAQGLFGHRLGTWRRVAKRFAYPLKGMQTKQTSDKPIVFLGNSAQTLHPVAAQGFNLGLREVAIFTEVVKQALAQGEEFAAFDVLQRHHAWCAEHRDKIMGFTNVLAKWFTPQSLLLPMIRGIGLQALDVFGPIKSRLLRLSMGFTGKTPQLMCGESR